MKTPEIVFLLVISVGALAAMFGRRTPVGVEADMVADDGGGDGGDGGGD